MKPKNPEKILQLFCGRLNQANMRGHKGRVFLEMQKIPWQLVIPEIYEWIYLLGVFDYRGEIVVESEESQELSANQSRIPSLFAISDHEKTHPELGTTAELTALIDQIHAAGGKVMLDFVANHTSTTHSWVKLYPDFYKRHNGQLIRQFSQDVFPLNYQNPDLRSKMAHVLKTIRKWGADGVRCDMAHLVPADYWQDLINLVKHDDPAFVFLAEAYSHSVFDWQPQEELIQAGFDSVYEEFFYRNLKEILGSGQPWDYLVSHINFFNNLSIQKHFTHYLANHDDPLPAGALAIQEGLMALLMCFPGMLLLPQAQLTGRTQRLAHHWLEVLPYSQSQVEMIPNWFLKLNQIIKALKPSLTSISMAANDLIKAQIDTVFGPGWAFFNLGSIEAKIDQNHYYEYSGWNSHKLIKVKPGSYEFLTRT